MHYIVVDGENKIIASHIANGERPADDVKVSKTNFSLIKNMPGKIYKYVDKKIIEEDDVNYLSDKKKEKIIQAISKANNDSIVFFEYDSKDGYKKVQTKDIEKELSDKVNAINKCKTIEELNGVVI